MASYTSAQAKDFIEKIGPLIQAEALKRGYQTCSAVIAQAVIESAAGESSLGKAFHNYFGLKCGKSWKGKSVNLKTKEEYKVGVLTTIKDNFRAYDSMEEGVKGYFDFINTTRYANLKTATTPHEYLIRIKNDGYATSSTYVNTNMSAVNKYNLARFDEVFHVKKNFYPAYFGTSTSIVEALKAVGETKVGFADRKMLAAKNGIVNYSGTAEQNKKLLKLLKEGVLVK